MRLFVAADVADDTRAQIRAVRDQLERRIRGRGEPRVTWVNDDAAHVTLQVIGEVSDEQAAALQLELSRDFALPPFDVRWDRFGTFPDGRAPRVIWIGSTAGAPALAELSKRVAARLGSITGPGEDRPFRPHVTIGRVKDPGRIDWPDVLASVTFAPTITRVDHVTLYRSRLSPKGATYTALCQAALRSGRR